MHATCLQRGLFTIYKPYRVIIAKQQDLLKYTVSVKPIIKSSPHNANVYQFAWSKTFMAEFQHFFFDIS